METRRDAPVASDPRRCDPKPGSARRARPIAAFARPVRLHRTTRLYAAPMLCSDPAETQAPHRRMCVGAESRDPTCRPQAASSAPTAPRRIRSTAAIGTTPADGPRIPIRPPSSENATLEFPRQLHRDPGRQHRLRARRRPRQPRRNPSRTASGRPSARGGTAAPRARDIPRGRHGAARYNRTLGGGSRRFCVFSDCDAGLSIALGRNNDRANYRRMTSALTGQSCSWHCALYLFATLLVQENSRAWGSPETCEKVAELLAFPPTQQ